MEHFVYCNTLYFSFTTVSTGTLPHTCIFPQSSVAFMMLPVTEVFTAWPPSEASETNSHLSQWLIKFCELHQRCYVLLCAPMFGVDEQKVLSALQQQYLDQNIHFLPAHSSSECVDCMINIARVTCKPLCLMIHERFQAVQEQFTSEDSVFNIVNHIGIGQHETHVLLDGCNSVSVIAQATVDDLLDCSLDSSTAKQVQRFFHSKE